MEGNFHFIFAPLSANNPPESELKNSLLSFIATRKIKQK